MSTVRGMPWGIGLFLVYALVILAGVALALGPVVEEAVLVPITFNGIVLMALLAYTIFTVTLVLQRKEAARNLAIGLATLTIPAIPFALLFGGQAGIVAAAVVAGFAILLYTGLRSAAVRAWLNQP